LRVSVRVCLCMCVLLSFCSCFFVLFSRCFVVRFALCCCSGLCMRFLFDKVLDYGMEAVEAIEQHDKVVLSPHEQQQYQQQQSVTTSSSQSEPEQNQPQSQHTRHFKFKSVVPLLRQLQPQRGRKGVAAAAVPSR
jgi:hypothetical protein